MFWRAFFLSVMSWGLVCGKEYRILGIGAAPIDLLIQVDDVFFTQHNLGRKGGSLSVTSPDPIERLLLLSGASLKKAVGGSAATVVRSLSQLGEKCGFFGYVGCDLFGEEFGQNLEKYGVVNRLRQVTTSSTPRVLCMISPGGQRTFMGYDPVVKDCVPTQEELQGVEWVHVEARQFDQGMDRLQGIERAKASGARISLDLSSFEVVQRHKEVLVDVISRFVQVVFCNEDEIRELTGLEPEAGCLELQKMCPVAVVTLGSQGCLIGQAGVVVSVPTASVDALDTTGAGDFFAAGFLYGYLRDQPLVICAKIGHLLGGAVVQQIGAHLPETVWKQVRSDVEGAVDSR
jgi:sugar/nucleoside kinase (ribokinase family)